MTAVLVDANVLLDVMTEDTRWLAWSANTIAHAADRHRLVINRIVYAGVSMQRSRKKCSTGKLATEGWNEEHAASGLLHVCSCGRCRIPTHDAGCGALSYLFS